MGGARDHYVKRNKLDTEGKLYMFPYVQTWSWGKGLEVEKKPRQAGVGRVGEKGVLGRLDLTQARASTTVEPINMLIRTKK